MKMNRHLSTEKILCLQLLRYKPSEILQSGDCVFNKVIKEQEDGERLLAKAAYLLDRQEKLGIQTLPFYHPDFPDRLRDIGEDCPPLIHLLGNAGLLRQNTAVAIIGARQADEYGCEAAYKYGTKYAKKGYVVISGLALGCDTAAHQGCLAAKGKTIAVVASGLDIIHPKENKFLQQLILKSGGLLLSEQVIGVKANPTRLIARNRLQAALSETVIVAQCTVRSGTMHTVRFAIKYHKKIYAVQFAQYGANSSGNKYLIEENSY